MASAYTNFLANCSHKNIGKTFTSNLFKGKRCVIYVKNSLNTYDMDPPNDYEETVLCQIESNNENNF